MIDIANQDILRRYLKDKQVFDTPEDLYIRFFPGGVSGTVAFASGGEKSVVIKQALPFLKVAARWACDPRRMLIEHRALEVYARLVPQSVPLPIFFDEENYIMVRQAAPESCRMWKEQLLGGLLDFRVAKQAALAIAAVHNGTAGDAAVRETFLDDSVFYSLRINPYIETAVDKHPRLARKAEEVIAVLMHEKIALVHGDYSPKNILVGDATGSDSADGGDIFILDMEVAHYGHPAFDLAFFSNHFFLKSIKNRMWKDAYLNMLRYMLDRYFSGVRFMDKRALERDTVRTLGFLLLARVDGKSPAEYITEDADKDLVRSLAFAILDEDRGDFAGVIETAKRKLAD
ncbi:MAG: phosphotransferase [Oscillospiraceae bacterium]|jgi:hypothetical protein|nr:phosphotransferase [Oscillospiraceae bacterium]